MKKEKTYLRIPIGAKLIVLILSALTLTVFTVVFNANSLFKKDNLDNIYLFSDLLTAAKAGEARFWLDSAIKKSNLIAQLLSDRQSLERYASDKDILFVNVLSPSGGKKTWTNDSLLRQLGINSATFRTYQKSLVVRKDKVLSGLAEVKNTILNHDQPILLVNFALPKGIASVGLHHEQLIQSFSDTGPYSLALVDGDGNVIAHKNRQLVLRGENLSAVPIVARMLVSKLEREFQEFEIGGVGFLAAYAKLGFAGLGVISQLPKEIALETSQVLVNRSFHIAILVLSIVFILSYAFVESIVSPIRRLSGAAREIAVGNYGVRVTVQTKDELLDLGKSFNHMGSEIERRIQNLNQLNDASQKIAATTEPQKLLDFSVRSILQLLCVQRGFGWVREGDQLYQCNLGWYKNGDASPERIEKSIDPSQITPYITHISQKEILVIPIPDREKVKGYITLSIRDLAQSNLPPHFQDDDLVNAGTFISSVGIAFENIRLLKETAEKARMEKELETAKHVQDTMFPPATVQTDHLEIQSYYTPAAECGGDWWGYLELEEEKTLIAIGDATGHGAPAAMVTATSKAVFSVLSRVGRSAPKLISSPKLILFLLNNAVFEATQGKVLMTFFVGVIDKKSKKITYSSASHDPIYLYKTPASATPEDKGKKEFLDVLIAEQGQRLGQSAGAQYSESHTDLNSNDVLILYTDGIPEAKNSEDEEYGERKFLRLLTRYAHQPLHKMRDEIIAEMKEFTHGEPLHDDITLVLARLKN